MIRGESGVVQLQRVGAACFYYTQPRIGFLSIQIRELTSCISAIISIIKLSNIYIYQIKNSKHVETRAIHNTSSTHFSGG